MTNDTFDILDLIYEVSVEAYQQVLGIDKDRTLLMGCNAYLDEYKFRVDVRGTKWEEYGVYEVEYKDYKFYLYVDIDYFSFTGKKFSLAGVVCDLGILGVFGTDIDKLSKVKKLMEYYENIHKMNQVYYIVVSCERAKLNEHTIFCYYADRCVKLNLEFSAVFIDFGRHYFCNPTSYIDTYEEERLGGDSLDLNILSHFSNCYVCGGIFNLYVDDIEKFKNLDIEVYIRDTYYFWTKVTYINNDGEFVPISKTLDIIEYLKNTDIPTRKVYLCEMYDIEKSNIKLKIQKDWNFNGYYTAWKKVFKDSIETKRVWVSNKYERYDLFALSAV